MEIWSFPADVMGDLVGFEVEAADGSLGRVERQVSDAGRQHLIVDTGVWLFGRSVLLPGGAVTEVDAERGVVTTAFTKEQIKGAPRFVTDQEATTPTYLRSVSSHYLRLTVGDGTLAQ